MKLINTENITRALKEIEKAFKENDKAVVVAKEDNFNRKILENYKVYAIIGVEYGFKKDRLKQRNSGLNHVFCRLAEKNNIKICIDFSCLYKFDDFEKSIILSRIMQNIRLCRKYKANIILANTEKLGSKFDLFPFLISLGMDTRTAKYAIDNQITIS
ncbi:MAG: hypothetical protein QW727_03500 [Candidatus Pacearchaeota archaeon]